jgi:drug/metabolite transporter (DMT)-like permease
MNISQIYIVVAIVVFVVIVTLIFVVGKKGSEKRLTPLTGLAFAFVLAGILFGDNRLIGYGLMGVGVLLAVVDILRKRNKSV